MSNAADGYLGDWLPHKGTCKCTDCDLERATTQIRTLKTQLSAAQAELSRVCEWWSVAYDGEVRAGEKLFAAFNKMRGELAEAKRKGQELCSAYGNALLKIHDLEAKLAAMDHSIAEANGDNPRHLGSYRDVFDADGDQ